MHSQSSTSLSSLVSTVILDFLEQQSSQKAHDLYKKVMNAADGALIRIVLNKHQNNKSKAARILGISRPTIKSKMNPSPDHPKIGDIVETSLNHYWSTDPEHQCGDLYRTIRSAVEHALLRTVLNFTNGNETQSASILNISRTTLRAKISDLHIH